MFIITFIVPFFAFFAGIFARSSHLECDLTGKIQVKCTKFDNVGSLVDLSIEVCPKISTKKSLQ